MGRRSDFIHAQKLRSLLQDISPKVPMCRKGVVWRPSVTDIGIQGTRRLRLCHRRLSTELPITHTKKPCRPRHRHDVIHIKVTIGAMPRKTTLGDGTGRVVRELRRNTGPVVLAPILAATLFVYDYRKGYEALCGGVELRVRSSLSSQKHQCGCLGGPATLARYITFPPQSEPVSEKHKRKGRVGAKGRCRRGRLCRV